MTDEVKLKYIELDKVDANSTDEASSTYEELLDQCQLSRFHFKMFICCGCAWVLDGMELYVYGLLLPRIEDEFSLSKFQLGLLSALRNLGGAFGALILGNAADRCGTRQMFLLSLGLGTAGGCLAALANGYVTLVLCVTVNGFGFGANIPLAVTYLREFIPTDYRATMLILMHFWFTSGTMISALLDWGCGDRWRLMLFLATVPGFFLLLALYFSDEKPQFLLRMGKTDQVRKILRKMNLDEDKVVTLADFVDVRDTGGFPMKELWRNHRLETFLHIVCWSGLSFSTAITTWFPLYMDDELHFDDATYHLLVIGMGACGIIAFTSSSVMVRYFEITLLSVVCYIIGLILLLLFCFFVIAELDRWLISVTYLIYYLPNAALWTFNYVLTPRAFVEDLRSSAMGVCQFWKYIAAILSPLLLGAIIDLASFGVAFFTGSIGLLFGTIAMFFINKNGIDPNSE